MDRYMEKARELLGDGHHKLAVTMMDKARQVRVEHHKADQADYPYSVSDSHANRMVQFMNKVTKEIDNGQGS